MGVVRSEVMARDDGRMRHSITESRTPEAPESARRREKGGGIEVGFLAACWMLIWYGLLGSVWLWYQIVRLKISIMHVHVYPIQRGHRPPPHSLTHRH
jgi:hypothetical protein